MCPRCGGRELLNTTNAVKHLKVRHEAEYAHVVQELKHRKQSNLIALPDVFLTQQFREYAAALDPRFALPTSRGGLCSLLDGRLQVIKENIVREVEGSAGALVTVDIWSGRYIKDSFIAATIHYTGGGSLKNVFGFEETEGAS
ncbi:hypothetical protein Tcan_08319 [Toxocara canis]|uniref:BED-type domain-containing protein n=1 Tax=Toxocara canis TaxID=6265 RepID=A0A0B2VU12_TOXCA|nr:hypothetical protein Tcan_08319 [Toxocara canis]